MLSIIRMTGKMAMPLKVYFIWVPAFARMTQKQHDDSMSGKEELNLVLSNSRSLLNMVLSLNRNTQKTYAHSFKSIYLTDFTWDYLGIWLCDCKILCYPWCSTAWIFFLAIAWARNSFKYFFGYFRTEISL